jgi:hypothetical protein
LYLVRPNGLLFLPGILWLYRCKRKAGAGVGWRHPVLAFAGFLLVAGPWMIRTAHHFGNPLHIAGNAGLLRDAGQSHTLTLFQYLAEHNPWFPLQRFFVGIPRFFAILDHYEHGLEIAPLLAAAAALALRRPFFGPFLSAGFLISGAVCGYAAYNGWAAVRYMSPMLPFIYAYGLSSLPLLFQRRFPAFPAAPHAAAETGKPRAVFGIGAGAILLLLLPVAQPHRFYQRVLKPDPAYAASLADHLRRLQARVPAGGTYYAGSLCAVNFLAPGRDCVGLQELYDTTWFSRSMAAFRPGLVALTPKEAADGSMRAALDRMRAGGYAPDTLDAGPLAVHFSLHPAAPPGVPPEGGAP